MVFDMTFGITFNTTRTWLKGAKNDYGFEKHFD